MNILVTVGTTSFDSLIFEVDRISEKYSNLVFTFQIADGEYIPKHGRVINFIENISEIYEQSDLVISHCGAGTIYQLLELNKLVIAVPNMERVDPHQTDIANYLNEYNYALVCQELTTLEELVSIAEGKKITPYTKDIFFKQKEICELIKSI